MSTQRRALAAALLAAAPVLASGQESAPSDAPAPAPTIEATAALRLQGPVALPEARQAEVRRKLARTITALQPNVVHLSIEQRVGDNVFVAVEASGLVLDPQGHIVTIGTTIEQAARVAVHFTNRTQFRPRRARIVGIDAATDVGLLEVGPLELPELDFVVAPVAMAPQPMPPTAQQQEWRYVVTLCGVPDEQEGRFAAGWMHDPLANPTFGPRRFDRLLRVEITHLPRCAGGVLAQQDGRVVGLMLAPAQATGGAVPVDGMLALPSETLRRGVQNVLARESLAVGFAPAPSPAAGPPRAWIGFGAADLDEPEFLRQLGVARAVVVSEVFEESPALAAGLEPHDVLLAWNGEPLAGLDSLYRKLSASVPGGLVKLDCVRGLERRKVDLTLGAW